MPHLTCCDCYGWLEFFQMKYYQILWGKIQDRPHYILSRLTRRFKIYYCCNCGATVEQLSSSLHTALFVWVERWEDYQCDNGDVCPLACYRSIFMLNVSSRVWGGVEVGSWRRWWWWWTVVLGNWAGRGHLTTPTRPESRETRPGQARLG